MRPIYYLILLLVCSCKNTTPETDPNRIPQNDTLEWLFFHGDSDKKKNRKIVLISGDEEYRSEELLPQFAKMLSLNHGFDCTVLFAQDPEFPGIVDPNYVKNIPGLDALEQADLMVLFTRFRDLPDEQMQYFQNYLEKGKPIFAIRTATHAFHIKDSTSKWMHWDNFYKGEKTDWEGGFGKKILGANWHTHHGHHKHQSTRGFPVIGQEKHPVLENIIVNNIWGSTDVYGHVLPLPGDSKPIVLGQVIDREEAFDENDLYFGMRASDQGIATVNPAAKNAYNPNDPMMPIVWTKSYQLKNGIEGKSLTSTIGSSSDFNNNELRRLFINACYYLLDLDCPKSLNADLVGDYHPSPYSFQSDEYWTSKNSQISKLK